MESAVVVDASRRFGRVGAASLARTGRLRAVRNECRGAVLLDGHVTYLALGNERPATLRRDASQRRVIVERVMLQRVGRAQQLRPPVDEAHASAGRTDGCDGAS